MAPEPTRTISTLDKMEAIGKLELLRLFHRLVVFAIARWYVALSVQAFVASITVLRSFEAKGMGVMVLAGDLIADLTGPTTMRKREEHTLESEKHTMYNAH